MPTLAEMAKAEFGEKTPGILSLSDQAQLEVNRRRRKAFEQFAAYGIVDRRLPPIGAAPGLTPWETQFAGKLREGLTFGAYRPRMPEPKTPGEALAGAAGYLAGQMVPVAASYGLAAPLTGLYQAGMAAKGVQASPVAVEAFRGLAAGGAYGAMRAAAERQAPSQVPFTVAQEAVLGMIGDVLGAGLAQILQARRAARNPLLQRVMDETAEEIRRVARGEETVDRALRSFSEISEIQWAEPPGSVLTDEIKKIAARLEEAGFEVPPNLRRVREVPEIIVPGRERPTVRPELWAPRGGEPERGVLPSRVPALAQKYGIDLGPERAMPEIVLPGPAPRPDVTLSVEKEAVRRKPLVVLETATEPRPEPVRRAAAVTPTPEPAVPVQAAKPPEPPVQVQAVKPYEGLRPGTPDWMETWRAHPELQEEMLEYGKRVLAEAAPGPSAPVTQARKSVLEEAVRQNLAEVQGEREALGIVPTALRPVPGVPKAPEKVEKALTATTGPKTWFAGLVKRFETYASDLLDAFTYHRDIADYPSLRNATRLFEGAGQDAMARAVETLRSVVGDSMTPREYEIFRRLVVLRDFIETGGQGITLPRNIKVEDVAAYYRTLLEQAPQHVLDALKRHDRTMKALAIDLVQRGKLDPSALEREAYYPHYVLDYLQHVDAKNPQLPRRLRSPFRYYTKQRFGSVKDIDTDYLEVMFKHLSKINIDNAADDFAARIGREYDLIEKLSPQELVKVFGDRPVRAGTIYYHKGKPYIGWAYGWVRESQLSSLVETALRPEQRVFVLPVEVAKHLDKMRYGAYSKVFGPLVEATQFWKRMTLDFAGVPFQVNNFVGDAVNLYREDPAAFLSVVDAVNAVVRGEAPKDLPDLLTLLREQRVAGSGLMRHYISPVYAEPSLAKLQPWKSTVRAYNPLSLLEKVSGYREDILRTAKFITDLRRIKAGKQVFTRSIDITGLSPIEAAGKVAREFTVDYGAISPEMKAARQLAFPFLTFYVENFKNWYRYVTRNPGDAALKFGVPMAALWVWNNYVHGDTEKRLPDYYRYMPHLITGYKTEGGRPIILAFQTPVDLAGRIVGLDRLPDRLGQVARGEVTAEQAARDQLRDMGLAPVREGVNLLNPLVKTIGELLANRDSFTGRQIVPERLKGTRQGRDLQLTHVLENFITPYAQYMRTVRYAEEEMGLREAARRTLESGPLDVKRALGIRTPNLGAEMGARFWEGIGESEEAYRQLRADLEEAYIAYAVTGNDAPVRAILERRPTAAAMMKTVVQSPRVRLEVARRKLRMTSDPSERERLKNEIAYWSEMQKWEAYKELPPVVRGGGPLP